MNKWEELDNWVTLPNDIALKTAKRRGNGHIEDYQKEEIDIALRYVESYECAVDIGAHVGIITNALSKKFKTVYSFELDPEIYSCCYENIVNRQQLKNVHLYNCGIGSEREKVDVTRHDKTFGTHVTPNKSGNINVKPLDSFNIPGKVGFIKIDVEGYETKVIQGALKLIERDRPVILYERKGHQKRYGYKDPDLPLRFLQDLGYTKYQDIGYERKNAVMGPKRNKRKHEVYRRY